MRWNRRVSVALGLVAGLALVACQADQPTGPTAGLVAAQGGIPGPGGGEPEESYGNNLSYPVILADHFGILGASVTSIDDFASTGFRPLETIDAAAFEALSGSPAVPFWYSGNTAEPYTGAYPVFWQKTINVWQAEWESRDPVAGTTPVYVDVGDILRSATNLTTRSVIRVEHTLYANDGTTLEGFPMDVTVNPSSPDEEQGIYDDDYEQQTVASTPTVFTTRARLTIEKLDSEGGTGVWTYFDKPVYESFGLDGPGAYSAEINVGGKLLFGYVWDLKKVVMPAGISKEGWWRITFSLDSGSGVAIDSLAAGDGAVTSYDQSKTVTEVELRARGGGGGGQGNPNRP